MFEKICMMGVEIVDEKEVENFDGVLVETIDGLSFEDIVSNKEVLKKIKYKPQPFVKGDCFLVVKDNSQNEIKSGLKKIYIVGNGIRCLVSVDNERILNTHFRVVSDDKKLSLSPTKISEGNFCWWNKQCRGEAERCDGRCDTCKKYLILKTDIGYKISETSLITVKELILN